MTAILGISAFYHDSAAALVVDGDIVAAAQEERFSRKKHDDRFPEHAVAYCLREAGLRPGTRSYDRCVNAAYNSNRRQADQAASQVAVGTAAALVGGAVLGAATAPRGYYYRCNAWGCW